MLVTLFLFALSKLISAHEPPPAQPTEDDLETTADIVATTGRTSAYLALLGDKSLLFNQHRDAFVMYATEKRSWVAMGDPVGVEDERKELVWTFRELVDRYGGWPVFYQVEQENLATYLEQGMTMLKLGEEARVPLRTFDLEGSSRKGLRQTRNRCQREECHFEVVPRLQVPPLLSELESISDAWLAEKKIAEKGFSLGFFDRAYLQRFPCALIRRGGKIIAFANMWCGANLEELSVDLMRYLPGSASGVMEFLFIELMLWGKEQGYQWFNLGMAPLSGIENRPLAPLWNRTVNLVFRHGDHFYHFEGLREYKEKFSPVWSPKYLASPGGLTLPRVLADVAALIGRKRPS